MAFWMRHKFQSAKADGTNVTLVKPSNWNADHDINMDPGTIIGRPPGSGEGPAVPIEISTLLPVGLILPYGGIIAPAGYLKCDGQLVSTTDYAALFAVVGYNFGGTGGEFAIPDMRGRVAAHPDGGTNRLTTGYVGGAGPNTLGGFGGVEADQTYADVTVSGTLTASAGGYFNYSANTDGASTIGSVGSGGSPQANVTPDHTHAWRIQNAYISLGINTGVSYGGGGYTRVVTNLQPTLILNYVIKT